MKLVIGLFSATPSEVASEVVAVALGPGQRHYPRPTFPTLSAALLVTHALVLTPSTTTWTTRTMCKLLLNVHFGEFF